MSGCIGVACLVWSEDEPHVCIREEDHGEPGIVVGGMWVPDDTDREPEPIREDA